MLLVIDRVGCRQDQLKNAIEAKLRSEQQSQQMTFVLQKGAQAVALGDPRCRDQSQVSIKPGLQGDAQLPWKLAQRLSFLAGILMYHKATNHPLCRDLGGGAQAD